MKYYSKVRKLVRRELDINKGQSLAHREDHLARVDKIALRIARNYEVDLEVLRLAVLLHDLGQTIENKRHHVKTSVLHARILLDRIQYPATKTKKVIEAIRTHSSEDIKSPRSLEGKILYDADKIDGLGAVGIVRTLIYCGQRGMSPEQAIQWYIQKIDKAYPHLQTPEGKKEVENRLKYVKAFIQRFYSDYRAPTK